MKKISIWYSAAILVVLLLTATEAVVAQDRPLSKLSADQASLDRFIQNVQAIRGRRLITGENESIQPLDILQEPAFTSGNFNIIRWNVPEEPITFIYEGDEVQVSIDSCSAVIHARANGNEITKIVPVTDGEVRFDFDDPAWLGTTITYSCFFGITYDFDDHINPNAETITSSYQDVVQPTVALVEVDGPGKNGWLTTNDVTIKYLGIQDTAGIFSVKLSGDINVADSAFFNSDPFNPQPTQIDSGAFTINLADGGPYIYNFSTCDAAYDAAMPPRNPNATWVMNSNCAVDVLSGEVKVDTQAPQIILPEPPPVFNPKYPGYDAAAKTLTYSFPVYDALSHVDSRSVNLNSLSFDPALPFDYDVVPTYNDSKDTCYVTLLFTSISQVDVVSTLQIDIADSAGNPAAARQELRFNFKPSEIISFFMVDPDYENAECLVPDSLHANESRMLFYSLSPTDDEVEKIRFFVKIDGVDVGQDTVDYPEDNRIIFDPLEILNIAMPDDGAQMSVTLSAIDVDGNEQPANTRPTRSITFDRTISDISVSVADTSAWDNGMPGRYGAFEGWTNEATVRVTIESPDDDWYHLEETSPENQCFENPQKDFLRTLSVPSDSDKTFTYRAGDFAGNMSNFDSENINLDTSIFVLEESHIRVYDPDTGSEISTASDSVNIAFNEDALPTEHNISRIVVNDSLYYVRIDDVLKVKVGDGNFTVSVIDLAGNETRPIPKSIKVEPGFSFVLSDTSTKDMAKDGWINDKAVEWDFVDKNFEMSQVQEIRFYKALSPIPFVTWPNGTDSTKIIPLDQLFDLQSGLQCNVTGYVILKNGAETPEDNRKTVHIIYDDDTPVINSLTLADTNDEPRTAEDGFTNDLDVLLTIDAFDEHSGLGFVNLEGNATFVDGSALPETIDYQSEIQLLLNEQSPVFFTTKVTGSVRDFAGNWMSEPKSRDISITFLNQKISVLPEAQKVSVREDETKNVSFPLNISCDHHEYLAYAEVTSPNGSIVQVSAMDFIADGVGGYDIPVSNAQNGFYTVQFVDKAGTESNIVQVEVEIVRAPAISVTLYDYSEYEELQSLDDEFTDALNEDGKIYAVVSRDSLSGMWDSIQFTLSDTIIDIVVPETNPYVYKHVLEVDTSDIVDCYITIEAKAKNQYFPSNEVTASILHDITEPVLSSFNLVQEDDSDKWSVEANASDDGDCQSPIAGIIIKDETASGEESTKWYYKPYDDQGQIVMQPESGLHYLTAFVVDMADVDQTVGALEENSKTEIVKKLVGEIGILDHASDSTTIEKWVLPNKSYNLPNPFNPELVVTKIKVPRKDVNSVDVRIFDLFGNLVYEKSGEKSKDADNFLIEWNGSNGNGVTVASGTYLAVITLDNGETLDPIKIGVLRKSRE